MQAAGAASSTVGSFYAAQSQRNGLNLQADLADRQAQGAVLSGEREQQRSMLATSGLKGKQRAALAANGVDLGQGSALNTLTTTDVMGEIDRSTIEANALRSAWGYRTEATMKRATAGAISPTLAATSSLLGGAASVAQTWYAFDKAGAFDKKAQTDPRAGARGQRGY